MNKINSHLSRILVVTSNREFYESVKAFGDDFSSKRAVVERKQSVASALKTLGEKRHDVCLIDHNSAKLTGLILIHKAVLAGCRTPLILANETDDENLRIEALQTGAAHFLWKAQIDAPLLEKAFAYAIEKVARLTELRENVNKFRGLVETLPVMIYAAEPQAPYAPIYISPAFEAFGFPLTEWHSSTDFWMRLLHPDDAERVLGETEAMMNAGLETDLEYRMLTSRGAVRWVHDRGRFVRDNGGKLICWQGVIIDITDSKNQEKARRESEAQFKSAFEDAGVGMAISSLGGRWLQVNEKLCSMLGYTKSELTNRRFAEVTHDDDVAANLSAKDELFHDPNAVYQTEKRYLHKDGSIVWAQLNVSMVMDEANQPLYFISQMQDITSRKAAVEQLTKSEMRYHELFENANDLIYTRDLEGNFTSVNRACEETTGYSRDEIMAMRFEDLVAPDQIVKANLMMRRGNNNQLPPFHEFVVISKSGQRITLEISTRLIYQDEQLIGVQGIARNITERQTAQQRLRDSEQKYRQLGEGIMHQIWTAAADGKLTYANERTLEYLGLTIEEAARKNWDEFVHPEDLVQSRKLWALSLDGGGDYETEFRLRRRDGEYFWFQARATAGRDASGNIVKWFGTNTEVDDRKKAEAQLQYVAGHDTLTGLPNRARFMNHLERVAARANHDPTLRFAVLFLDLDRFKIINDSLGHSIGDQLLVEIGNRLQECLRPSDIVARIGGDEFTVLLSRIAESEDAVRVANRFLERLAAPFKLDNYEVFTSASIGIIISDEVKRQPEDFLRDADAAMYRAKASGKSRCEVFDREMHLRNINLLQVENDLRRAIENNEFRVFYQPIVELRTGEIREFEALLRWEHPQRGLVPPNDFISIAEETGLIIPIGRWILEEACRQTVEWQRRFPQHARLSISVNLSAKQLLHPNLTAQVADILTRTKLDSHSLQLEVTESMVMENGEKSLAVINGLRELGSSISTDDFGTGYSSLSYLHRFPFDRLKIDRSFVSNMDSDRKSDAIVRTVLLLAQNLNIEVVAEGIETESQLDSLRRLECVTGQGYLFSKPVAAAAAELLLANGLPNIGIGFYDVGDSDTHQLFELNEIQ